MEDKAPWHRWVPTGEEYEAIAAELNRRREKRFMNKIANRQVI